VGCATSNCEQEGLERSAAIDGYDLDTALQNLVKTVEVAKKETDHDHR
jgi:hypothetical protein